MKTVKRILFTTAGTLLFAGAASINLAAQDIISESGEIDLNATIQETSQSINKLSSAAQPLQQTLETDFKEVQALIQKVNADPNNLNKSEFQLAYAKVIQKVMTGVDNILRYRDEIYFNVEDFQKELSRVNIRLDLREETNTRKLAVQQKKLEEMEKALQKKAREIDTLERMSPRDDETERRLRDLKRDFKREHATFKREERLSKILEITNNQLSTITGSLSTGAENLEISVDSLDSLFENLEDTREALVTLAGNYKDINELYKLQKQGLGGIADATKNIAKLTQLLESFSDVSEGIENTFITVGDMDMGIVETSSDEPWRDFLN